MTGVTGILTPDETERAFVPREWHETSAGPEQGDVTRSRAAEQTPNEGVERQAARTHIGGDDATVREDHF